MTAIGGAIECEHEQFQKRNQEKFFFFKEASTVEERLQRGKWL